MRACTYVLFSRVPVFSDFYKFSSYLNAKMQLKANFFKQIMNGLLNFHLRTKTKPQLLRTCPPLAFVVEISYNVYLLSKCLVLKKIAMLLIVFAKHDLFWLKAIKREH